MKRTLSLILAIAMLITLMPTIAIAGSETAEKGYTLTYDLTTNALSSRVPRNGTETASESKDVVASDGTARQMHMFDWNYKSSEVAEGDTGEVPYNTLDLTKTAPYKIENRASRLVGTSYTEYISDKGIKAQYMTAHYANTSSSRPHVIVRLKIDKPGVYNFTLKNSEKEVWNPFAEVWFGKAGEEYLVSQVDSLLTSGDYECLGWWSDSSVAAGYFDRKNPAGKQFDAFTVNVPEAGEYWAVLNFPSETTSLNGSTYTYLGNNFQFLGLSEMKLVATGEDPKEEEITGPVNQIFDFTQYNPGNAAGIAMFDFKYDEHGWEVDMDGTSTYLKTSLWNTKGIYALGIYGYTRLEYLQYRPYTLDLKIEKEGYYDVSVLLGLKHANNGYGSVYIDGKYMGQLCNVNRNDEQKLRPIKLTAGKHKFTVIADKEGTTANQAYINISKINFKGIETAPALSESKLSLTGYEGYVGDSVDATASLKFSNGTSIVALTESYLDDLSDATYNYNSYKTAEGESITLKSSNPAVAKVDGTKISFVGAGTADITFSATLDGVTKSVKRTVTVNALAVERPDNFVLTYQTSSDAMSTKLPKVDTKNKDDIGLNGTTLYNLDLMNWRKVVTVGDDTFNTLDTTKTAPFAIETITGASVKLSGVHSTNVGKDGMDFVVNKAKIPVANAEGGYHLVLRLDIPYGGLYKMDFVHDGGAEAYRPYTKIFFGKAADTYDYTKIDEAIAGFDFVGWWSANDGVFANTLTVDNKEDAKVDNLVINVPEKGEYWLIFDLDQQSLDLNSALLSSTYQRFRLKSFTLTGIEEEEPVRPDNFSVTYNIKSTSISSRVPTVEVQDAKGEYVYEKSGSRVLYRLELMDWKKTMADDDGIFNTLDTSVTGSFKLESEGYGANSDYIIGDVSTNIDKLAMNSTMKTAFYTQTSATRPHVALRLLVPYGGKYELTLEDLYPATNSYEPYCEVYFGAAPESYVAADIDGLLKDYNKLGWWHSGDGYFAADATPDTKASKKLNKFVVDVPSAGEYYLVLNMNAQSLEFNSTLNSATGYWQYFRLSSVTLKGVEASAPEKIESNIPRRVTVGDSATVTAKIKMSDGTYATFGGENTVAVTGDNFATVSDVATNGDTVTFKVTGANVGDAKVTVSGKVNGKDYSYSLDITIKAAELPRPENFSATYDLSIAALSDKVPSIDNNTYAGEGIYKGSTLYNFTYLDWKRVAKDESGADYNPLDLEKTSAYKLELVNNKYPAGATNGNSGANGARFVTPLASYTNKSGSRPHVAIRLVVPYAGMYEISLLDGQKTTYEPYVKVYFGEAPKTYNADDIDNLEKEYEFLGWWYGDDGVNANAGVHYAPELSDIKEITPEAIAAHKVNNFAVNVPASGEYYLILDTDKLSKEFNPETLSGAGVNHYFGIKTITLKGVSGASVQDVETDMKEVIALDKEYTVTAKFKMNDRKYAKLDGDCVISVNGSENLTVSDIATSGEKLTFKVKGTAVSDAEKITFSGSINGNEFSIEKNVIVAANETVNKVYEFNKYITSGSKPIMTEYTYDKDGWEINKDGTCTYLKDTFWKTTTGLYPLGIYAYLRPSPLTYRVMAFDFAIDQDGFYDVSMLTTALDSTNGGWLSVYIDGKYVGQINGVQGSAGDTKLRPLELKEGKHTLFVAGDRSLGGTHARVAIGNLKFAGTPAKASLSDVTMTLPAGNYFAGTSITAETTIKFDNGVETVGITESYIDDLTLSSYNYNSFKKAEGESMVITSSDEEIAKVEGKTIKLLSDGEVDITFTAILDGVEKSVTKTIEVQKAILSEITAKGETGYILIADTDGIAINVTGKLSDGNAANLEGAEVILTSSDPSVAAIENGRVIPKSLGDVTITVLVVLDGEEVSTEIDFTVSEEPIAPSFAIMYKDKTSQATSKGGYYTTDTRGDTWTINTEITDARYFNGSSSSAVRIQDSVQYGYFYNYGDFAVDFVTDMDGNYDVELEMIPDTSTSGDVQFFIDGQFVGVINAKAPVRDLYTPTIKLGRPVSLKAGKHTFLIRKPGNAFVNGIRLIGTAKATGFKGAEITVPTTEMSAGESNEYSMQLVWENGAALDVPITNLDGSLDAQFEVTSSDSSIISVSGKTFKALKAGVANLETSAEFAGSMVSGATQIIVDDATFDYATLNLDEELMYFVGGKKNLETNVVLTNGKTTASKNVTSVTYTSSNESIAKVVNGQLQNLAEGEVTITASATFNGVTKSVSKTIRIENVKLVGIRAESKVNILSALATEGSDVVVYGINNDGSEVDLGDIEKTVESLTPDILTVDEEGKLWYASRGTGKIHVAATIGENNFECDADVVSSSQKTEPTIFTYKMREQALVNAEKYDWARSLQKSAINTAQKYLDYLEKYYDLIPAEGIPRSYTITTLQSPADMTYICPYCRSDIRALHGAYSWVINPVTDPWKIACPECKRKFPSNDFESFYKLGLKGDGTFDRALAYQKNQELVDAGEDGYLVNELYPEVWKDEKLKVPQDKVVTWMVDDGFGWSPKSGTYGGNEPVTTDPKWAPIAYYTHVFWDRNGSTYSVITRAMNDLRQAYLYTGDAKYGRAGAILLDRIADVYDDYDITKISLSYSHSHGGDYSGKTVGSIWETNVADSLVQAYDAFYPMMDDPQVIKFLSEKAVQYGNPNPKLTGDMIRENAENGVVRSVIDGVKTAKINGNFGMHQYSMALAAVALDTYPETGDAFEWMALPGGESKKSVTDVVYGVKYNSSVKNNGGEMLTRYINEVCRDGFGNEVGIGYNMIWITNGIEIADLLHRYGAETKINLYENPKYLKMFNSFIKLNVGQGYAVSIGDSGGTASNSRTSIESTTLRAFNMLKDPKLAQNYYWAMKGNIKDIYIDIFTDNAGLSKEIQAIVDAEGEYEFESEMLTGYGFSVLRYGDLIPGANGGSDLRGDAWMYHGRVGGHGHNDALQLGIDAYGFNFGPDLGYPEATGYDPNRLQWCSQTISHNTVSVNGESQIGAVGGTPLHFDDAGKVQVMDVDFPEVYSDTDIYRRTVVSVEASSDVSYTVDFFRIKGGKEHTYSFHTQSYNGYTTDDLELVPQVDADGNFVGTYAGADVPLGPDPNTLLTTGSYELKYTRGYTWLDNVQRATNLDDGNFSVNFKQTDFRRSVKNASGLNLKFTALNDWTPSQVGFATGYAPNTSSNKMIPGLDYMLIHRKGKNLDTLFTSVLQPYNGEEYIASMESVAVEIKEGRKSKDDVAKAVKVVLKNGRTDYVIYSTNNQVLYTIDGKFDFRGVIGVYSLSAEGENIYAYVNDGDVIGDTTGMAALSGTVADFSAELTSDNYITVALDGEYEFDVEDLAMKYVYVDNVHSNQNGAYRIVSAEKVGENVVLNLGDVSLVKNYIDNSNPEKGYVFNVQKGQTLRIPMNTVLNDAPVIAPVSDGITASAGSAISVKLRAESPLDGKSVTYKAITLPRGATLDEASGTVTWKPDSSQLGENGFVIAAVDEDGRESSVSFVVDVYGSTSGGGGGSSVPTTPKPDNSQTIPSTKPDADKKDETTTTPETPSEPSVDSKVRFIDLGSYAWAADAINALADDGIIKGTSENTFSPAANITRADFAILLVRAFELASESEENFADVSSSDYFAKELAVARNTGLVNGIGDNKFAPRNNISRQDMMVIVYRAMQKIAPEKLVKAELVDETALSKTYNDYALIADYAKEAVSVLSQMQLVNGKSGRVAPTDNTTRAEVAVLIKRILDFVK